MKCVLKIIIAVFLISISTIICLSSNVIAADYYVSSSSGNDSNNGKSTSSAWRTLSKIESSNFVPGDRIFLKRGDEWREDLHFAASGNSEKIIKISSYGVGTDKPSILGSMIISQWQKINSAFRYAYNGLCSNMLEDARPLKKVASIISLKPGCWCQDNSYLYYQPSFGFPSNHVVERCSKGACIFLYGNSYIVLEGLCLYGGNTSGLIIKNGHDIQIKDCTVTANGMIGIEVIRTEKSANCSNILIKNCLITWNANGIYFEGSNGGYGSPGYNDCEIVDNEIAYNNYQNKQSHLTSDGHAIGVQNSDKFSISGNYIHHNYSGIALWTAQNYVSNDNIIMKNFIYSNELYGICQGGEGANNSSHNIWARNIIVNNGNYTEKMSGGMRINRNNNNFFIYNTLVGNDINIYLYSVTDNQVVKYNISADPTRYHVCIADSAGRRNIFDTNLYYSHDVAKFKYREDILTSFGEWQRVSSFDSNAKYADPKFVAETSKDNVNFYKLTQNSTCIDAGENVSISIGGDFFGRECIGKPDLGAIESGTKQLMKKPSILRLSSSE